MAFEALLTQSDGRTKKWRRRMVIASLVGHGVVLLVGIAHSMWQVEELPMPTVQVTLVSAPPPPPPPPPPAKRKSKTEKKKQRPKEDVLVQPKEIPQEPEPEPAAEEEDEGEDEGVQGGVAGGVAGGVVGGVVGGPPPPKKKEGPEMLNAQAGRKLLLSDPSAPGNRPNVPRGLRDKRLTALVLICADTAGRVTTAAVKKGTGTPIDAQLPGVMRRWRYKPFVRNGVAVPFCYHVNYVISER